METTQPIHDQIAVLRRTLAEEAQESVQDYWTHHFRHNPNKEKDDKTRLGVRLHYHRSKDHPAFSIQWYWNRWVRDPNGKRHTFSNYISKGRTRDAYHPNKLLRYARDWEADLVLELETIFTRIRGQIRELNRLEAALRRFDRLQPETQSSESDEADTETTEASSDG